MSDRIKQLKQFITEEPDDPFNHYALGLELLHVDQYQALDIFLQLSKTKKDYLPTYYQLGKLYEQLGKKEEAIQVVNVGIIVARQQQDLKTLRELNSVLEELNDD
jgi:uncharacterized protein HemY